MENKDIYSLWGTSKEIEVDGFWLDYGCGIKFLLARSGGANKLYHKKLGDHYKKYKISSKLNLDEEAARNMIVLSFVDAVLKDWVGVTHKDTGEALKCTRENALMVFEDLPDLFDDLREESAKIQNFQAEIEASEKK